jgi:hypothetical protein
MNAQSLFDLSGKVAIVTGSTKGIGEVEVLRHAPVGRRHQLFDGVEVMRGDRGPRPVALDHLHEALVLAVRVHPLEHPGRRDRPQDLVQPLQFVLVHRPPERLSAI